MLLAERRRCPDCGCFIARCGLDDTTCANERCESSWQAARRQFETSMLGAAVRQVIGDRHR